MYAQYQDRNNKASSARKFMFITPPEGWPRPPAKFLSMEVVSTKPDGSKVMSFKKSDEYEAL
jgi:hypothetical protein